MSQANTMGSVAYGEEFGVGRALSWAFTVFGQGATSFLALTAIAFTPLILLAFFSISLRRGSEAAMFVPLVTVVLQIIVHPIATAACLFGAYQVMRGYSFTVGDS